MVGFRFFGVLEGTVGSVMSWAGVGVGFFTDFLSFLGFSSVFFPIARCLKVKNTTELFKDPKAARTTERTGPHHDGVGSVSLPTSSLSKTQRCANGSIGTGKTSKNRGKPKESQKPSA